MAGAVLFTNASLIVNGVDLSLFVKAITLNLSSNMIDNSPLGGTAVARVGGLQDGDLLVMPNQDFTSASTIDAILWGLYNVQADTCVEIRPNTVTSCNPAYSGHFFIDRYTPMGGAVGGLLMAPFTMKATGSLSRVMSG